MEPVGNNLQSLPHARFLISDYNAEGYKPAIRAKET